MGMQGPQNYPQPQLTNKLTDICAERRKDDELLPITPRKTYLHLHDEKDILRSVCGWRKHH